MRQLCLDKRKVNAFKHSDVSGCYGRFYLQVGVYVYWCSCFHCPRMVGIWASTEMWFYGDVVIIYYLAEGYGSALDVKPYYSILLLGVNCCSVKQIYYRHASDRA